jgi:hypothetical protein
VRLGIAKVPPEYLAMEVSIFTPWLVAGMIICQIIRVTPGSADTVHVMVTGLPSLVLHSDYFHALVSVPEFAFMSDFTLCANHFIF